MKGIWFSTSVLAEIGDKMMSLPTLLVWNAIIVLLTWWFVRKNKWLAVIPLSVALIFAFGGLEELREPHMARAVIQELGYFYVALNFLPLLMIAVLLITVQRRLTTHRHGERRMD